MTFATLQPGDAVVLSAAALRMGLAGRRRRRGTVLRYSRAVPWCVRVWFRGYAAPDEFAAWLLVRVSDGAHGTYPGGDVPELVRRELLSPVAAPEPPAAPAGVGAA